MKVQLFRLYQQLASEGLVESYVCSYEPEHGQLFAGIDDEDNVYIHCLACKTKIFPRDEFFSIISEEVKKHS